MYLASIWTHSFKNENLKEPFNILSFKHGSDIHSGAPRSQFRFQVFLGGKIGLQDSGEGLCMGFGLWEDNQELHPERFLFVLGSYSGVHV